MCVSVYTYMFVCMYVCIIFHVCVFFLFSVVDNIKTRLNKLMFYYPVLKTKEPERNNNIIVKNAVN